MFPAGKSPVDPFSALKKIANGGLQQKFTSFFVIRALPADCSRPRALISGVGSLQSSSLIESVSFDKSRQRSHRCDEHSVAISLAFDRPEVLFLLFRMSDQSQDTDRFWSMSGSMWMDNCLVSSLTYEHKL